LHGDEICGAQENWNLTKELARVELLKLPSLSHNILQYLEQAIQNGEKPRISAFAYDPISAFHADICRLLCESLAHGFVASGEKTCIQMSLNSMLPSPTAWPELP
jgi:hypothetical protein